MEELFKPERIGEFNEELLFEGVELLKEKLGTKRNSMVFLTMIADSFKNKGSICKIEESEDGEIIFEFIERE
jgi:hypothetical protein